MTRRSRTSTYTVCIDVVCATNVTSLHFMTLHFSFCPLFRYVMMLGGIFFITLGCLLCLAHQFFWTLQDSWSPGSVSLTFWENFGLFLDNPPLLTRSAIWARVLVDSNLTFFVFYNTHTHTHVHRKSASLRPTVSLLFGKRKRYEIFFFKTLNLLGNIFPNWLEVFSRLIKNEAVSESTNVFPHKKSDFRLTENRLYRFSDINPILICRIDLCQKLTFITTTFSNPFSPSLLPLLLDRLKRMISQSTGAKHRPTMSSFRSSESDFQLFLSNFFSSGADGRFDKLLISVGGTGTDQLMSCHNCQVLLASAFVGWSGCCCFASDLQKRVCVCVCVCVSINDGINLFSDFCFTPKSLGVVELIDARWSCGHRFWQGDAHAKHSAITDAIDWLEGRTVDHIRPKQTRPGNWTHCKIDWPDRWWTTQLNGEWWLTHSLIVDINVALCSALAFLSSSSFWLESLTN